MKPSQRLIDLSELRPVVGHARLEIDGLPCLLDRLYGSLYEDAIVRVNKYLYMNGAPLTEDSPKWADLWVENDAV